MKKQLLQIFFSLLGLLALVPISFSQQILNANFSEFSEDLQSFDNWEGTAIIHTDLLPDSGNAAKISSYVLFQNFRTCVSWGIGKDGRRTCALYENVPVTSVHNNSIEQTINNLPTIPATFSADVALINSDDSSGGKISIEGYYNGYSVNTIFVVTTTSLLNQKVSIPLSVSPSSCTECPQNYLSIKIESMAKNDPTLNGNSPMPSIIIDNLKFEGIHNELDTTKTPSINNISITNYLPTKATINYKVSSYKTADVIVKYGLSEDNLDKQVTGTMNKAELENLQAQTTYFYQIIASNTNGETESVVDSFMTTSELLALAQYPFNNELTDVNGNNPFSTNNGISFISDRNGNPNSALQIVNTGSEATILNLPYENSKRTVSVWVKLNSFNNNGYNMIYSYGSEGTSLANGGGISATKAFHFGYNNNHEPLAAHQLNTWYHYAFVYDGITSSIYRDGVLLGTNGKIWNTIKNGDKFRLGIGIGNEYWFDGAVDDLRIFDGILNETQINYLAQENDVISSVLNLEKPVLNVYPNPASEYIHVAQFSEVFDLVGNKVASGNGEINVSSLTKGFYILKSGKASVKFIKD